jgi:hypothetical protein
MSTRTGAVAASGPAHPATWIALVVATAALAVGLYALRTGSDDAAGVATVGRVTAATANPAAGVDGTASTETVRAGAPNAMPPGGDTGIVTTRPVSDASFVVRSVHPTSRILTTRPVSDPEFQP